LRIIYGKRRTINSKPNPARRRTFFSVCHSRRESAVALAFISVIPEGNLLLHFGGSSTLRATEKQSNEEGLQPRASASKVHKSASKQHENCL
jgi:hypothetical protein